MTCSCTGVWIKSEGSHYYRLGDFVLRPLFLELLLDTSTTVLNYSLWKYRNQAFKVPKVSMHIHA